MNLFFKIFAVVFAILFAWAAYLQNNDPDAFLWYIIYGVACLACVSFLFKKLHYVIALILAFSYLIGIFISWPAKFEGVEIGGGDINNIEHAREALGLLINSAVMGILAWRMKKGDFRSN